MRRRRSSISTTAPIRTSPRRIPRPGGACVGTGLGPRDIGRIVGITKAYTTRVGAGPFPTELLDDDGDRLVDVGREFGTVTGRRRRAGWLDCVMLRHAVRLNSLTELALTKLDILDGFETIKICTGYWLDGHVLENYPDRSELLAKVEPIYETIDGWGSVLNDTREPGELAAAGAAVHRDRRARGRRAGPRRRRRRRARRLPGLDVVIPRYSTPEMDAVWSDESRFARWLEVELLATEGHAALGVVPAGGCRHDAVRPPRRSTPRSSRRFSNARRSTDHDVAAFVDVVQAAIGQPAGSWIHYGLTSSDVVDTALCWAMTDATDLLIDAASELLADAGRRWPGRTATR